LAEPGHRVQGTTGDDRKTARSMSALLLLNGSYWASRSGVNSGRLPCSRLPQSQGPRPYCVPLTSGSYRFQHVILRAARLMEDGPAHAQSIVAASSRRAAHFSKALRAGHSACPHSVRPYSTFGGTWWYTSRRTIPSFSIWRSCWISIFCEIAGIARSRSENRSIFPPNRWNRMSSFQRPSSTLNARSTPSAAEVGVRWLALLLGVYLTFSCVLVVWRA
jgi:hypothetical protein